MNRKLGRRGSAALAPAGGIASSKVERASRRFIDRGPPGMTGTVVATASPDLSLRADLLEQAGQLPHLLRPGGVEVVPLRQVGAQVVELAGMLVLPVMILRVEPRGDLAVRAAPRGDQHPLVVPDGIDVGERVMDDAAARAGRVVLPHREQVMAVVRGV